MAIFLVVIDEPSDIGTVRSLIAKHYPKNSYDYHSDAHLFLIRCDDTTGEICENLRIQGDAREVSGVVFKMNTAYSGFTQGSLWEWMGDD